MVLMPFKITAEGEKTDELSELERLQAEIKILKAQKERAEMEISFLKN